jgi:hypothetical protein
MPVAASLGTSERLAAARAIAEARRA